MPTGLAAGPGGGPVFGVVAGGDFRALAPRPRDGVSGAPAEERGHSRGGRHGHAAQADALEHRRVADVERGVVRREALA